MSRSLNHELDLSQLHMHPQGPKYNFTYPSLLALLILFGFRSALIMGFSCKEVITYMIQFEKAFVLKNYI